MKLFECQHTAWLSGDTHQALRMQQKMDGLRQDRPRCKLTEKEKPTFAPIRVAITNVKGEIESFDAYHVHCIPVINTSASHNFLILLNSVPFQCPIFSTSDSASDIIFNWNKLPVPPHHLCFSLLPIYPL